MGSYGPWSKVVHYVGNRVPVVYYVGNRVPVVYYERNMVPVVYYVGNRGPFGMHNIMVTMFTCAEIHTVSTR